MRDYSKKIKYQEDFMNNSWWNTACNFLETLRAIELKIDDDLSVGETEDLINDLIALKKISKKAGLNSGDSYEAIGTYLSKLLSRDISISQVGFMDEKDQPIAWSGRKAKYDFVQLKWDTINSAGNTGQHWTLGDKEGKEIYDPYQGPLEKVKVVKRYLIKIEVK